MNPYAIPSLVAAILGACIGFYVLHKDPKSTINRIFTLLAFVITVWCFGQFMHRITQEATSLMWYRVSAFGWCFVGGMVLHFALIFAKREKILRNKLVYLVLYGPPIIFLYLAWSTDLIFQLKITEMPWGNTVLPGDLVWTYTIYIFLYIVLGAYFCSRVYKKSFVSVEKKQSLILIGAFLIPLVISSTTDLVLPMIGIVVMELAALSCVVAAGIVAYAILKYKLFVLPPITKFFVPAPEALLRTKLKYRLKEGRNYLIKEPERGPKIFKEQVTHGVSGLWLTTLHPNKIREKYELTRSPILYLTPERVSGEVAVPLEKLDKAIGVVSNYFFARPRKSVVFVDCLKELIVANGLEKAMDFLKEMTELCYRNNSNLIVQIDSSKFEKQQLAAIEKVIKLP